MARKPTKPKITTPPTLDDKASPEELFYLRNKATRGSFHHQDVSPEEHAFVWTVAKATQIEVLESIHKAIDQAIAQGETVDTFKAKLEPTLVALGWWGKKEMVDPVTGEVKTVQLGSPRRLETIYWSNIRAANAAGVWERAQRTKDALPFFIYQLGPSKVHRDEHIPLEGMILPVDHPFWDKGFPPNGWGCKCWVRQITEKEARELGYKDGAEPPDLGTRTYINARTGERVVLPAGIDPDWSSNAGKLRQEVLSRHLSGAIDNAPDEIKHVVVRDAISTHEFRMAQERQSKAIVPIAVLPESFAEELGATSRTVNFSGDTAEKQAGERPEGHPGHKSQGHADVQQEDYVHLQTMLEKGQRSYDRENHMAVMAEINGRHWFAVIKKTTDGSGVFLQSFYPVNEKDVARRKKKYGWS